MAKEDKRRAFEQALASAKLEGHEPTPAFLADIRAIIVNGTMTTEQARGESLERALSDTERRLARDEALANARIEGHVPTLEFLADFDAVKDL